MANKRDEYTAVNSVTWDKWADNGCVWTRSITHEAYAQVLAGDWDVYLTPCRPVPKNWFGNLKGEKILGLASGGGIQMPVFAALGAQCTVFDNSQAQIDREKLVCKREGYNIDTVKGDMTKPLPFPENCFDIIFHPVSNCYIEDVHHVWSECFRVLKKGGVLIAGFDNGLNFLFDDDNTLPLTVKNKLPFNPLKASQDEYRRMVKNDECIQFSHSLEEQLGGQLKAGFAITALFEDRNRVGDGLLREYTPQFIATRAIKP
jgi:ubiquinone/menaquinone biosynthesis C-methylase UbiE